MKMTDFLPGKNEANDFAAVAREDSWGVRYKLNGRELQSGDDVDVLWPDGEITQETIGIETERVHFGPQDGYGENRLAHFGVKFRGATLYVEADAYGIKMRFAAPDPSEGKA